MMVDTVGSFLMPRPPDASPSSPLLPFFFFGSGVATRLYLDGSKSGKKLRRRVGRLVRIRDPTLGG